MSTVAVVAHRGKILGGGLDELRERLAHEGVQPLWYEVPKSKEAPKCVRSAVTEGADQVLVWGGDGMVQRCIDALAGTAVEVGILPAGTANLLAANLGIPANLEAALGVALHGARRKLDVGTVNGEHFAVMAGTGLDALMIRDATRRLKDRFGRATYVWAGARHLRATPVKTVVRVDGSEWFRGRASCVLFGNVGTILGGVAAFPDAAPDDGVLEIAVVTADGALQWARVLTRLAAGTAKRSPLVRMTAGASIDVRLGRPLPYELDGGDRKPTRRLRVTVAPAAVTVAVSKEPR